jgi:hypothetical protein
MSRSSPALQEAPPDERRQYFRLVRPDSSGVLATDVAVRGKLVKNYQSSDRDLPFQYTIRIRATTAIAFGKCFLGEDTE